MNTQLKNENRKILLGIAGGIAAYKTPDLIRQLVNANYEVKVVVTKNALEFVSLLTLQTLLPNNVFEILIEPTMQHIQLAKWAHLILIAPATANIIAKINYGIADDLLSTVCLATTAPIFIAPAMNQAMWKNVATQNNVMRLKRRGVCFLGPDDGIQACGDSGPGRMLEPEDIIKQLENFIIKPFLKNTRILITAGATRENIDPVRFISNKSSGKMGYALANAATVAGAIVTVISGVTYLEKPLCEKLINAVSAKEMLAAVENEIVGQTIFISVAAVSDFTVEKISNQKIKRKDKSLKLALVPTTDIISLVCAKKNKPFVVAFAAETENVIENAKQKRFKKGADMIVVNDVSQQDIGFDSNENAVTIISENKIIHLEKNSKQNIAQKMLEIIFAQLQTNKSMGFSTIDS